MSRLQRLYRQLRRSGIDRFEARDAAPKILAAAERIDARYAPVSEALKDMAMEIAIQNSVSHV